MMSRMAVSAKRKRRGFTLIEIITVMSIFVILGYSLSLITRQLLESYQHIRGEQEITDTTRSVWLLMREDLKNMYIVKDASGTSLISTWCDGTPNSIDFHTRSSEDGTIERVQYAISANGLERSVLDNGGVVQSVDLVSPSVLTPITFQYGYRNAVGNIVFATTWDSRLQQKTNFSISNVEQDPDGAPCIVDVAYNVQDRHSTQTRTWNARVGIGRG